jgi:hypothetical protein
VIWVGADVFGRRRTIPAWFVYKNGRIFLLSQKRAGPAGADRPGRSAEAKEFVVVTRRKGRDTAAQEFTAAPRLLEGAEWEDAAKALGGQAEVPRGAPAESIGRVAREL